MKLAISICLVIVATCFARSNAEEIDVTDWSSVEILRNETLTVRVRFRPVASVADQHWIVVEIENVSDQPLKPKVLWVEAAISTNNGATDEPLSTRNLGGRLPTPAQIEPGETYRSNGRGWSYTSFGVPSKDGLNVTGKFKYDIQLAKKRFTDYEPGAEFKFQWRAPNETEITLMTKELKERLGDFDNLEKNYYRFHTLMESESVVDQLSLTDDYLPALKKIDHVSFRFLLLGPMFRKHAEAPEVSKYYREQFATDPDSVYSDGAVSNNWNHEFLEPLVQGCEQENWHYFGVLQRHKKRWHDRPEIVTRVSKALLKHNPILSQKSEDIPDDDLGKWARAIEEAADVGDKKLIELFKPALSDRRDANINLGAGGINESRVCDRAMKAILTILDGDWSESLPSAPAAPWTNEEIVEWKPEDERKDYDEMIEALQKRLATLSEND